MKKILGLQHQDPMSMSYVEYRDHIVAFNKVIHDAIAQDLGGILDNLGDDYAIATTGSDARLEKGPVSVIEFMLFNESRRPNHEVMRRVQEYIWNDTELRVFDDNIEVKALDHDKMYRCVLQTDEGTVSLISPNRTLDAAFIYGNPRLFVEAKNKLVDELTGPEGKPVLEKIKDRTKEHRKTTLSGEQRYKGELLQHYDPNTGVAFYNPDEKIWSFKQGPMRAVQYALVRDSIRSIREGCTPEEVLSLPTNTITKLNSIEVQGYSALSRDAMSELTDCYKFFLWAYHASQDHYNKTNRNDKTTVQFSPQEIKDRVKTIDALCAAQIMKLH